MLGSARAMTYAGETRKLQMLNAWSTQFGLCLWAEPIPEKTNEIPVSQELCRRLDVRGKVVTVDSLNAQTGLAKYLLCCNSAFYDYYRKKRDEGKPHRVAVSHCARKLVRIIYKVETEKIDFDPNLVK